MVNALWPQKKTAITYRKKNKSTLPSSYLDINWVWWSFKRLFSSHNFVITISLSISNFGRFCFIWALFNGNFGCTFSVGDVDGDRLFCCSLFNSSFKCRFTYDWNDFVLLVCFNMGILLLRPVGESAMIRFAWCVDQLYVRSRGRRFAIVATKKIY